MSLVSAVMGKHSAASLVSDLSFESLKIQNQLNRYADIAASVGERISNIDNMLSQLNADSSSQLSMQNNLIQSSIFGKADKGMIEEQSSSILNNFQRIQQMSRINQMQKQSLEREKDMLHHREKALQSRKQRVDTQLKLAEQRLETSEKLEDKAIKRFAPKI